MRRWPGLALLCACALLAGCDYFRSPEGRVERARAHVEEGEHRRALVELKNALQDSPDLVDARMLLAETALWLGDPQSAQVELNRAGGRGDAVATAELRLRIDLALGRHADVLAAAGEASELPAPRRAWYRGQALKALGKPAQAEEAFREALADGEYSAAAMAGIAESRAVRGQLPAALGLSAESVEKFPDSAAAWHTRGALLVRDGKLPEAEEALLRTAGLAARQFDVLQQVAVLAALIEVQLANGKLDAARQSYAALNQVAPGTPLGMLMSGRIAMAANDFLTATSELRRVVNAAPTFAQARFMLGIALAAEGNLTQANQELVTVVEQSPDNLEARQLLAQVRMRQQDPDGALRVLVPAVIGDADNSKLASLMASINLPDGDARAIPALERALAAAPGTRSLQVQLASAYLQGGKPRQALELLRLSSGGPQSPGESALLVQARLQSEGLAAARAEAQSALARHARDPRLVALAAAIDAQAGDAGRARLALREALGRSPEDADLLFALARVEWAARQPEAARAALTRLLVVEPGNATATLALAELERDTGDLTRATALLEGLRQAGNAVEPRIELMKIALRGDDARRAEALAGEIFAARPGDASIRRSVGLLYLAFARYDQSLAILREASRLQPGDAASWFSLGRAQSALGQAGPAADSFRKALSLRPGWVAATGAMAFLELRDGQRDAALARVAALKREQPRDADVHALEGEVLFALRDFPAAAASFDAAYALQPSPGLAVRLHAVRVAGKLGDPAGPLERWVRSHPDDLSLVPMLAEAYVAGGNLRAAVGPYERLLARDPGHVPSLNNLAWVYHQLGDARATPLARRAASLAPESAAVADTLGWILVQTGQTAEGLTVLERALTLRGVSPEIRYHHAAALERAGRGQESARLLEELLRDPGGFPSREEAERLRARLSAAK